jgi:hypothetical protein
MIFCYPAASLFGNLFAGKVDTALRSLRVARRTSVPSSINVNRIAQTGSPAILAISGLK